MNLHEYQAKEILKKYGLPIPNFAVASTVHEATHAFERLHMKETVLKIQVHAGGRGKAGGVKFAKSKQEVHDIAGKLIGMKMVNHQTGPDGVVARQILLSEPVDIKKEYYISVLIDRALGKPVIIASREGGMEIEEVAEKHPEKILKMPFEGALKNFQILRLSKFLGLDMKKFAPALVKAFIETDASLLEINPLVETPTGEIIALDAKLAIDDNAAFRHKEIEYDSSQDSPQEIAAKKVDLAYIAMHGEIGCMVNGAGLAMATMDIIQLYGASPANFLDVGGGATKEKVAEGFKIILSDPKVKAILVNIFGGIMSCATIAEGIIYACQKEKVTVPIVVRMEGTHVNEGKKLLKQSGLNIQTADDMKQAAEIVCGYSRK